MKTLHFFAIISIAAILLSSCKKEEDEGTPRQTTKTFTHSQNIRGSAGIKGELPPSVLSLSDIIGTEAASNFKNGEMQLASSHLEISGLNQIEAPEGEAVILENFTIKVGSRQAVNLGNCSTDPQGLNDFSSDVQQSTNEIISIIQNIFTDITSGNKSSSITISFTPNVDILSSDNVQLKISIGGTYHYVVFE